MLCHISEPSKHWFCPSGCFNDHIGGCDFIICKEINFINLYPMCIGLRRHKTTAHLTPKAFVYLPDIFRCIVGIFLWPFSNWNWSQSLSWSYDFEWAAASSRLALSRLGACKPQMCFSYFSLHVRLSYGPLPTIFSSLPRPGQQSVEVKSMDFGTRQTCVRIPASSLSIFESLFPYLHNRWVGGKLYLSLLFWLGCRFVGREHTHIPT